MRSRARFSVMDARMESTPAATASDQRLRPPPRGLRRLVAAPATTALATMALASCSNPMALDDATGGEHTTSSSNHTTSSGNLSAPAGH
jgi:hypothetical protein